MPESNAVRKEEVKRSVSITPVRMHLAEYDRQEWVVNAELGTTIEDVLKPEYWAHMAQQMKPYDLIEVRAEDDAWMAQLRVSRVERSAAVVALLHHYVFTETEASDSHIPIKHEVQWKGPQRKFAVIRLSDSSIIKEEFPSREDAIRWLKDYERTTG